MARTEEVSPVDVLAPAALERHLAVVAAMDAMTRAIEAITAARTHLRVAPNDPQAWAAACYQMADAGIWQASTLAAMRRVAGFPAEVVA